VAPASVAKLALAAGWWDAGLGDAEMRCASEVPGAPGLRVPVPASLRDRPLDVAGMVAHSCTSAAVDLAGRLAASRGEAAVAHALAPLLAGDALAPAGADRSAFAGMGGDWRLQAAGIGPLTTTPLAVARFVSAVGRGGEAATPWAAGGASRTAPARLFSPTTAGRLRRALGEAVRQGTASAAAPAGEGQGWRLAGKTGTVRARDGRLDGWFAGLVERRGGEAEHVVVVWLAGAGPGGGRPTRLATSLASELAR
jgi:hypothetical protein